VLLAEMPRLLRCRHIPVDDLQAGRWQDHVHRLLQQPEPAVTPPTNGAEIAAEYIAGQL